MTRAGRPDQVTRAVRLDRVPRASRRRRAGEQGAQPAAVTRPQLAQHGAAVRARRAGRHRQARRHGRRREPLQEQHQDVGLARREPGGRDRVLRREMDELRLTAPPGREPQHEVAATVRAVGREQHLRARAVADQERRPGRGARGAGERAVRVRGGGRRGARRKRLPGDLPASGPAVGQPLQRDEHRCGGSCSRRLPRRHGTSRQLRALAGASSTGTNPSAATAAARGGAREDRARAPARMDQSPGRRPVRTGRRPPWGGWGWGIRRHACERDDRVRGRRGRGGRAPRARPQDVQGVRRDPRLSAARAQRDTPSPPSPPGSPGRLHGRP